MFETVEDAAGTVEFLMGVYESGNGPLVYPVTLKDSTYIGYVQAVPFDDGTWEIGYDTPIEETTEPRKPSVLTMLPVCLCKAAGRRYCVSGGTLPSSLHCRSY